MKAAACDAFLAAESAAFAEQMANSEVSRLGALLALTEMQKDAVFAIMVRQGAGITIKKGTDFVLQMHYHPTGRTETDQAEAALYLTDKPPVRHILGILMGT